VPRLALRSAKVAVFDEGDGCGGRPEAGIASQAGGAELGRDSRTGPEVDSAYDGHYPEQSRADPEPSLPSRVGLARLAAGVAV
jgi:hypothetical protein